MKLIIIQLLGLNKECVNLLKIKKNLYANCYFLLFICVLTNTNLISQKTIFLKSINYKAGYLNSISSDNQKARIIFPKDNLSAVFKLLSSATCPTITIKSVEPDAKNNIPQQIMIEFDGMIMSIFGLEHFSTYPDLTDITSPLTDHFENLKSFIRLSLSGWLSQSK